MTSIIMAIVIASAMAIIYPGPFFAFGNESCKSKFTSLLEVALDDAGDEDYRVTSAGKENFFKSLNRKMIGCRPTGFVPSFESVEVNNLDIEYQLKGDYINTVSYEEQVKRIGGHLAHGDVQALSVVNAGVQNGAKECIQTKSGEECVTHSQYLPPKTILQHVTGSTLLDCTFEVSLNVNCYVTFSSWRWYHWSLIWKWSGYLKFISARSVLSNLEEWDGSTAVIYLQCEAKAVLDMISRSDDY